MWYRLACKKTDLQLIYTLCGGQCFRWKKTGDEEWTGVFANRVWTLSQKDGFILYKVTENSNKNTLNPLLNGAYILNNQNEKLCDKLDFAEPDPHYEKLLRRYLRLDVNLNDFYGGWAKSDPHFKDAAIKFYGLRILAQDPIENLFAFICSSNNNISRISSMVEKMCVLYGSPIAEIDGITYFDFPPVSALADPSVEQALRTAGFGYRAKFVQQSASRINEMGGLDWLESLKSLPYAVSKNELMKLPGIGAKVADCICLMSLGHLEAIPVDTHIFQIAIKRYLPHLESCKTVTDRVYNEIGDHFRSLYGSYAGWAHTILFCADLKMFEDKVPGAAKKKGKPQSITKSKKKKVE